MLTFAQKSELVNILQTLGFNFIEYDSKSLEFNNCHSDISFDIKIYTDNEIPLVFGIVDGETLLTESPQTFSELKRIINDFIKVQISSDLSFIEK